MTSSIIQPGTPEHYHVLNSFCLTSSDFIELGTRIMAAYNQATPNDASNAAGSYAYFAAVRGLRDIFCPQGWESCTKHNLEMIVSPNGQMAIIASSGDKNTGLDGEEVPKTKNQKGNKTREIIASNQRQDFLFPEMKPADPIFISDTTPTWFLLYHVDQVNSEIRMELSLPINMDIENLRVDEWSKRVQISIIKFDSTPSIFMKDFTPEFKIEIKRK